MDPAKLRPAVICRFRTAVLFPKGFPLLAKKKLLLLLFSLCTYGPLKTQCFSACQ